MNHRGLKVVEFDNNYFTNIPNKDDVALFHRQGTLENVIYLINIITIEKIIKQPRQIHKISRVGYINTRLAPNIDMSHNIPFTTE